MVKLGTSQVILHAHQGHLSAEPQILGLIEGGTLHPGRH